MDTETAHQVYIFSVICLSGMAVFGVVITALTLLCPLRLVMPPPVTRAQSESVRSNKP